MDIRCKCGKLLGKVLTSKGEKEIFVKEKVPYESKTKHIEIKCPRCKTMNEIAI